jgi:hypothetical protein
VRSLEMAKAEDTSTVDAIHLEKVLPQLVRAIVASISRDMDVSSGAVLGSCWTFRFDCVARFGI